MSDKIFTYGPDNVDMLLATTVSHWMQTNLEDNVFNKTPFLQEMYNRKKTADGGASILVPILTDANSTSTWFTGYDELDVTPQEGATNTQAHWRNIAVSIAVSGDELRKNSGVDRKESMVKAKTEQAEGTIARDITSALFASSTLSKRPTSMVNMVDATSTVQDVNSTNNSFWQATVTTGGSFATQGLSDMRTTWTTIDKLMPNSVADIIPTTDTVYNYYEGSLTPQVRYTQGGTAEGSFEKLKFKTANVFYDSQCNSGVMYMYPSANLWVVLNSNADMKQTEFVKPANQDAKVAQIITMMQIVTNARRKLGKITGITA